MHLVFKWVTNIHRFCGEKAHSKWKWQYAPKYEYAKKRLNNLWSISMDDDIIVVSNWTKICMWFTNCSLMKTFRTKPLV